MTYLMMVAQIGIVSCTFMSWSPIDVVASKARKPTRQPMRPYDLEKEKMLMTLGASRQLNKGKARAK